MDQLALKQAFERVKNDIFFLNDELTNLKKEFSELKEIVKSIEFSSNSIKEELIFLKEKQESSIKETPTQEVQNPTHSAYPTHNPTDNSSFKGLKAPILISSKGNRGVPTDRQTNQQTDTYTHNLQQKPLKEHISDATEILNGLDAIKKEIRIKFKQMTQQEMLVFSTIYQLEEQAPKGAEYRIIAQKLHLSESSIRDYTQKLINKGIPIEKIKLNNKKILLRISPELKQVASLNTILQLREI